MRFMKRCVFKYVVIIDMLKVKFKVDVVRLCVKELGLVEVCVV